MYIIRLIIGFSVECTLLFFNNNSLKLRNVLDLLDQSDNDIHSTGKTLKVKVDLGHGTFMDAQT